ncbi:Hypothetical protein A7982_06919 [Minicystis rosea]|nr:Hypothetical protein A7982_06919 [Minicystis rosea]
MTPRKLLRSILTLGAAGLLFITARPAAACWDGYAASVGNVSIQRSVDPAAWSPDDAREAARWGARIDALLPRGAELAVEHGAITCTSATGACASFEPLSLPNDDLPSVFRAVAKAFRVPPARVQSARAIEPELYTVQVFAGTASGARAAKQRVMDSDAGSHGFFVEGGFPAMNDTAHVLREDGVHRAVVGLFLSKADAVAALADLRAKGIHGFVRELPAGKPIDERSYSRGG